MENTQQETIPEDEWMVRPCEIYDEEFSDCVSMKARFHQYFIFGKLIDCSQWKRDYENCRRWKDESNIKSCNDLILSEKKRRYERLAGHLQNDVWERRSSPPDNWNAPLPDWMAKKKTFVSVPEAELAENKFPSDHSPCVIL